MRDEAGVMGHAWYRTKNHGSVKHNISKYTFIQTHFLDTK